VDVVIPPSQISMVNWKMSLSLKLGIEKLPKGSDGVLIHLGDMPLVLPETIRHLVKEATLTSKGIVLPSYNGKLGHPRIFKKKYFEKLKKLKGDEGGRSIIANNLEDILICEVNDPGVVFDVDLPEDLEKMKFLLKKRKY
jgi:molybdenum cofactor cytidylyltransferase